MCARCWLEGPYACARCLRMPARMCPVSAVLAYGVSVPAACACARVRVLCASQSWCVCEVRCCIGCQSGVLCKSREGVCAALSQAVVLCWRVRLGFGVGSVVVFCCKSREGAGHAPCQQAVVSLPCTPSVLILQVCMCLSGHQVVSSVTYPLCQQHARCSRQGCRLSRLQ